MSLCTHIKYNVLSVMTHKFICTVIVLTSFIVSTPPPPPNIWGDLSINFAYIIWDLRCDVNFWGDLLFWGVLHSLYESGGWVLYPLLKSAFLIKSSFLINKNKKTFITVHLVKQFCQIQSYSCQVIWWEGCKIASLDE